MTLKRAAGAGPVRPARRFAVNAAGWHLGCGHGVPAMARSMSGAWRLTPQGGLQFGQSRH